LVAGSARSVEGLPMLEVLRTIERRHPGLFVKFGGHAMAAGLTIRRDDIEAFQAAFSVAVGQKLDGRELHPELWSDGDIDPAEITEGLLSALDEMEPRGRGFDPPVFESGFTVLRARAVGEDKTHLSLSLKGGGRAFGAIWFRALAPEDEELPMPGERLRLLYTPAWNWWRGERRVQIVVEGIVDV